MTASTRLAAIGVLAAGVAGCRVAENDRATLGAAVPVRVALGPGREVAPRPLDRPMAQLAGPPEPVPFDRSGWRPAAFVVPNDWVLHHPEYTIDYIPAEVRRAAASYPDPIRALEMPRREVPAGAQEGLIEWGVVASDVVLFLPRVVLNPFWNHERSPQWGYERAREEGWVALALSPSLDWSPAPPLDPSPLGARPGVVRRFQAPPPPAAAADEPPTPPPPPAEGSRFEPQDEDAPEGPPPATPQGSRGEEG